jgi:hypothetical protein
VGKGRQGRSSEAEPERLLRKGIVRAIIRWYARELEGERNTLPGKINLVACGLATLVLFVVLVPSALGLAVSGLNLQVAYSGAGYTIAIGQESWSSFGQFLGLLAVLVSAWLGCAVLIYGGYRRSR